MRKLTEIYSIFDVGLEGGQQNDDVNLAHYNWLKALKTQL